MRKLDDRDNDASVPFPSMRSTIHLLTAMAIVSACGATVPTPTNTRESSPTPSALATTAAASAGPLAFALPQDCRVVNSSRVGQIDDWLIDCGSSRNRSARDTIGAALTQQGWLSCGFGLASAAWTKGATRVGVSEPADAAVGFRMTQNAGPCS
jgi:hypothetical protein